MAKPEYKNILAMFDDYGEPCSNSIHSAEDSFCRNGHRQKVVNICEGHIPEVTVLKKGGCTDHEIKEGDWWGRHSHFQFL
ncbi:hypothetical protein I876_14330 [Alteromonas mediterranea U7]|jgi:hypothetical protein|uniref:hypothetical protein n=1 Tax=uncultured Alteromonas sp. TaxID=179113 RepID=UPI0003557A1B|nr:hypothetical protein I607_13830 [Alteromonas mediterranea U4]AGP90713.1 hypothetical protein I876_14330 [Alteromonas mediterranea U7]